MTLLSLFTLAAILAALSHGETGPISPEDYVNILKQGFATNYFKTDPPATKYRDNNIKDVYDKGFRNLRLRARADLYDPPYADDKFSTFLDKLEMVVDKCIEVGVAPVISWINHHAESDATEEEKQNYITWWTRVAERLENKDYQLAFNLFTELGIDECRLKEDCSQSLRENITKYNEWTREVVSAIRKTKGNNEKRIIILGSPKKTAKGLKEIEPSIYDNDPYMMAEFHLYASGPNEITGSAKYWDGSELGKQNVNNSIKPAMDWTQTSGIRTYFGAWMPVDNTAMALDDEEIISFAKYFAETMRINGIPWSLNVLDRYYNTKRSEWLSEGTVKGKKVKFGLVLNAIIKKMR